MYFDVVGEHDQRPDEVVPRPQEGEDGERDQDGTAERQDDPREDAHLAGAVDARGVEQLVGDREGVLADQEDAENACHPGEDHPPVGADQAQLRISRKSGRIATCDGEHQGAEQKAEDPPPAREAELGEGVARHRVQQHGEHGDRGGQQRAVAEVSSCGHVSVVSWH